jgi:hypothetical protein
MSLTLTSVPRRQVPGRPEGSSGRPRHPGWLRYLPAAPGRGWPGGSGDRPGRAVPPGVIGGAVIGAARRSAGLSRRMLGRNLAVAAVTVRAWETGALPLYRVSYDQLRELAGELEQSGAPAGPVLDDLLLASQCDLLVAGMLGGFEDYAEVPAVDHGSPATSARILLRWALAGDVPERYRRHARAGHLLAGADIDRFRANARNMASGARGPELADYGAALTAVAAGGPGPHPSRRIRARRTPEER